jgi:hypothetical protein
MTIPPNTAPPNTAPPETAPPLSAVVCSGCGQAYLAPTETPTAVIECPQCGAQARRDALRPAPAPTAPVRPGHGRAVAVWGLAGLLALAVLVAAGLGLRRLQPATVPPRPAAAAPTPLLDPESVETAVLKEARAAAGRILGHGDWTSARPWLLHSDRLGPLMERYHAKHPWKPVILTETVEGTLTTTGGRRVARLTAQTDRGTRLPLHLEETPEGWKIDWERLVQARQFAWEIFHEDRPAPPVLLHVRARRGTASDAHFAAAGLVSKDVIAVRLDGPQPGLPALAIVEKASDLGRLFQRELTWEQARPYRCELRLIDPTLTPPLAEITTFIGAGWDDGKEAGTPSPSTHD